MENFPPIAIIKGKAWKIQSFISHAWIYNITYSNIPSIAVLHSKTWKIGL